MASGTVMDKGFSAGGKPKAKIDGKWYFMPDGCNVAELVGKKIDFDASQFSMQIKGQTKWFDSISGWGLSNEQNVPQTAPQPVQAVLPPTPPATSPPVTELRQEALSTLYDHELRFISNVLGQALYAMTIKEPSQLQVWFDAAKACLTGTREQISRSEQTKSANRYAERINDAVREGNEDKMMSVWRECRDPKSVDFECAVFAMLSTPVKNRIRDLEAAQPFNDEPNF